MNENDISVEQLRRMAQSKDGKTCHAAAKNPATPVEALCMLAEKGQLNVEENPFQTKHNCLPFPLLSITPHKKQGFSKCQKTTTTF
ncbi:MAG: hypothetical protein LBB51_06675 [Zoogloeaceae bacterium]|nr:hypothetical protein [Zoogloeaceae bacterium]